MSIITAGGVKNFADLDDITLVVKAANETVNNSAVLQADNELKVTMGASDVVTVRGVIMFTSNANQDLKYSFSGPAGAAFTYRSTGQAFDDSVGVVTAALTDELNAGGNGATKRIVWIEGIYVGGGTAGDLVFNWCQRTAAANDTIVYANSFLCATKLG